MSNPIGQFPSKQEISARLQSYHSSMTYELISPKIIRAVAERFGGISLPIKDIGRVVFEVTHDAAPSSEDALRDSLAFEFIPRVLTKALQDLARIT